MYNSKKKEKYNFEAFIGLPCIFIIHMALGYPVEEVGSGETTTCICETLCYNSG